MKKVMGCLLLAVLAFTACEGPMGPPGKDGRNGRDGKNAEPTQWVVKDFKVYSKDWDRIVIDEKGDGDKWLLFEYGFEFDVLDDFVFTEGAVLCYLVQYFSYGGSQIRTHCLLPYTVYGEDDEEYPWSENYSCEISPGYINFTVKYSDRLTDNPPDCEFHVVILW